MKSGQKIALLVAAAVLGYLIYRFYNVVESYHRDDPMLHKLRAMLSDVHPAISQTPLYRGKRSYTVNKEHVYLCLRDEHGDYYDINTLVYVTLHEFAHVNNKADIGHTENFNNHFDDLLLRAESLGVYDPRYPPKDNYCTH